MFYFKIMILLNPYYLKTPIEESHLTLYCKLITSETASSAAIWHTHRGKEALPPCHLPQLTYKNSLGLKAAIFFLKKPILSPKKQPSRTNTEAEGWGGWWGNPTYSKEALCQAWGESPGLTEKSHIWFEWSGSPSFPNPPSPSQWSLATQQTTMCTKLSLLSLFINWL